MKINQKGFGAIEAILIVVVLGIVGGTGYYVWSSKNETDDTLKPTRSSTNKENADTKEDITKNWKTYTHPTDNYSIKYPQDWKFENYPEDEQDYIYLFSPDYKDNEASQTAGVLDAGAEIVVQADDVNTSESNYDSIEKGAKSNNDTYVFGEVNGLKTIEVDDNRDRFTSTFIFDAGTMFSLQFRYPQNKKTENNKIYQAVVDSFKINR